MNSGTIGFLGGTFDPIHFGHLNLAINLCEKYQLERVLFCPARISPFKQGEPPSAPEEARAAMLRLALASLPPFELLDRELKQPGLSYTIDTIRALKQAHPEWQLHLLLGEDALSGLDRWKESEELVILAPPLVGCRSSNRIGEGVSKIPIMEISSTFVRERLRKRLFCEHLVPQNVLKYIYENNLYHD